MSLMRSDTVRGPVTSDCAGSSSGWMAITSASYPASSTASLSWGAISRRCITAVADFPMRFTATSDTPGISESKPVTVFTQEAHVMPSTDSSTRSGPSNWPPGELPCFVVCGGRRGSLDTTSAVYPMSSTAATTEGATSGPDMVSVAELPSKLTFTSVTPGSSDSAEVIAFEQEAHVMPPTDSANR